MKRAAWLLTAALILVTASATFAAGMPDSFVDVVKKTRDGVVNISTTKMVTRKRSQIFNDELFRRFFGDSFPGHPQPKGEEGNGNEQKYKTSSLGSGFVIDNDGYIVTNNHVIEGADEIIVKLNDKHTFDAKVIGTDPLTDLALIKIEPGDLKLNVIELGSSAATEVGEWVVAIGNPLGLEWTVTAGIVSAKGRVLGEGPYDNFLQTDTSINPGNSGGPLLNMNGEVVAINTAIIPSGQGLGFAVPVDMLKELLPKLKSGKVRRGWLGVSLQPMDENLAKTFGLKEATGALIADVTKDDPADRAGLRAGDVILAVDGQDIADTRELVNLIGTKSPGDKVKVEILRDGKKRTLTVVLGERIIDAKVAMKQPEPEKSEGPITAVEISDEEKSALGIQSGVRITKIEEESAAFAAGLRAGDVVVWVNRKSVQTVQSFYAILASAEKGEVVAMKVVKKQGSRFLAFNKDW